MIDALRIWHAGVTAVGGAEAVRRALSADASSSPDQIIAVGKAAATMAEAALEQFGEVPTLVVTKDQHGKDLPETVRLIEAAHPVPDARSLRAGAVLRDTVAGLGRDANLLLLVSGGASALAEDLHPGKTLADLEELNRHLLASGLDITDMNKERRGISRIKGGGLLGGFTGRSVRVLAISDVPGDEIGVIGSGIGAAPLSAGFDYTCAIIASNAHARRAAETAATGLGLTVHLNEQGLHDDLEALVRRWGPRLRDMPKGVILLGGEPTVRLPENPGQGGRNQALALALAGEIAGRDDIRIVVGGTDGSDGPTDAAGAIVDGATWGAGAQDALDAADSGAFLAARGALLVTGPTGTNVMDLLVATRA